ncbi:MAG: antitoxin [Chloroflexi bacterium]|nr:MAG: antitoxin [Chloroflexota bacterium]
MTEQQILTAAIEKWGPKHQIDLAVEECSELIVALMHYGRGRCGSFEVAEEIADVEIMLEQLKEVFAFRSVVTEIKADKIVRLKGRILETQTN